MSWGTAAEVVTTVGTGIALLGVVTTSVISLRSEKVTRDGQKLEREQAEATARRSEAAAALTEEYTRRVVEALETMATTPAGGAPIPAPAPRVKWSMRNHGGDIYIVENIGDEVAQRVTLLAHESMVFDAPEPIDLQPGETLQFFAALTFGTEDSTISVEWSQPGDGELRRWRYPLPPRPPRK